MKTKVLILSIVSFIAMSFTNSTQSNDCASYYPLQKGTKWVYAEYDKKDKLQSKATTIVEDVINHESSVEYVIKAISENAKPKDDEKPYENTLKYFCKDGVLSFDMSAMVPSEYDDMDISLEQKELTIPSTLTEGMILEDAQAIITMNGMNLMTIDIVDRKIEKFESVTTEAGTFNCAKMTYTTKSKIAFMKIEVSSIDWISSKAGTVMSESYDKNGKKMNSRKLIEFSQGN